MFRAHRLDLTWELGEQFTQAVQYVEPGPARITVDQLKPGDFINYAGMRVWIVFDVTNNVAKGLTTVRLGTGLLHEPKFTVASDTEVQPLVKHEIFQVRAQIALPAGWTDQASTPEFLPIPYRWLDNYTILLEMEWDGPEFQQFISRIDAGRIGGGPSGSVFPYDVAVEAGTAPNTRWQRVLEGTLTTVRSSNFPSTTFVH
jgi:hypothetical protein